MPHSAPTPPSVIEAIYSRRAVRAYTPERLSEATVRSLLAAAVQAPTAVHLEPWAFVVVQNVETLKRYSDLAKRLADTDPRHPDAATPGHRAEGHHAFLADPAFNIFYDASTLIAICARPLGPYATADCWLAAENLMLAAYGLGLGTCPIGFAHAMLNQPEVKSELAIPEHVTVVAAIIVGVPRVVSAPVSRNAPLVLSWK